MTVRDINFFVDFVKDIRGVNLSFYRDAFLKRRLKAALREYDMVSVREFSGFLGSDSRAWDKFFGSLSIHTSEFFRDPEVFEDFEDKCLPELFSRKESIRCWSNGCSRGEEPYSLAILLAEYLNKGNKDIPYNIFGTDVNKDSLKQAKQGIYGIRSLKNMNKALLRKYFQAVNDTSYKVIDALKSKVFFRQHNMFVNEPLKFIDVVFLRNVMIYFSTAASRAVLLSVHKSLKKGGYLIIGRAEGLGRFFSGFFKPVSIYNKIFQKI